MTDIGIKATLIVDAIVEDLTDRRGLRQEWEQIEEYIQDEIKDAWKNIAISVLSV